MNEPVISILWSSFKLNRFYLGTKSGRFYICELYKKSIQIMRSINFSIYSANSTENILKSVDYIAQDDIDGLTIAIASKDGVIGYISNIFLVLLFSVLEFEGL